MGTTPVIILINIYIVELYAVNAIRVFFFHTNPKLDFFNKVFYIASAKLLHGIFLSILIRYVYLTTH